MIRMLRGLGVTPNLAYYASLGSLVLSLALWFVPRTASRERRGQLAIFVGVWPPTLMLLGHAIESDVDAEAALDDIARAGDETLP